MREHPHDGEDNGWDEHKRLVLSDLSELKNELRSIREAQTSIREDIAGLKALSGLIGGLAGATSSLLGRLF